MGLSRKRITVLIVCSIALCLTNLWAARHQHRISSFDDDAIHIRAPFLQQPALSQLRQRSVPPPPPSGPRNATAIYLRHMRLWRKFCTQYALASTNEEDYQQVLDDMAPFEHSGINRSVLFSFTQQLDRVQLFSLDSQGLHTKLTSNTTLTRGRSQFYFKVLKSLHPYLPRDLSITLAINVFDEPLGWNAPLPPGVEEAIANRSLPLREAWRRHSCDGAGLAEVKHLHGQFLNPPAFVLRRATLPILSPYKVPGCFSGGWVAAAAAAVGRCLCSAPGAAWACRLTVDSALAWHADILVPHLGSYQNWKSSDDCPFSPDAWRAKVGRQASHRQVPGGSGRLPGMQGQRGADCRLLAMQKDVAVFRGSSTGGWVDKTTPPGVLGAGEWAWGAARWICWQAPHAEWLQAHRPANQSATRHPNHPHKQRTNKPNSGCRGVQRFPPAAAGGVCEEAGAPRHRRGDHQVGALHWGQV